MVEGGAVPFGVVFSGDSRSLALECDPCLFLCGLNKASYSVVYTLNLAI